MLTTSKVDTQNQNEVRRFVAFPYRLYRDCPQWVPPPRPDITVMLNRRHHPFYEHSDADFYIAERAGEIVGRVAILEHRPYNQAHATKRAQFYLFECEDDQEAASALFDRARDWARQRGLDTIIGPKGFSVLDGYGLLVDGYEQRQLMTMMNYNYAYYPSLLEHIGFVKEVDFVSCHLDIAKFELPERIRRIAERVKQRESLQVRPFKSRAAIRAAVERIREAYNRAFVNNWEYCPLTQKEGQFLLKNALMLTYPELVKVIVHDDEMVGFLFGFPDVSAAMQRAKGRLTPWAMADLLQERSRTGWLAINGAGLVPEFHGVGGNALLYAEMEATIRTFNYRHADLTQVAETAVQMRRDLENVGGVMYKNHRVYQRDV